MKPGIYRGLPMPEYLAVKAVSAGILRELVDRCERAAWWESPWNPARKPDFNDASDAGTIAHEILLEGSQNTIVVVDPNDHPAEKGGAIPKGWTNKSIRAARDEIRARGLIPVLPEDMIAVNAMVDSARVFIESLQHTEPAVWAMFQPDGGDSELTMIWEDRGTLCKLRADRIAKDRSIIVDAKFTGLSADPDAQGRGPLVSNKIGAAWYRAGVESVCGVEPEYLYLVTEDKPPYLTSLVGVDPTGFALGAEKAAWAFKRWCHCVERDFWPGYPPKVCYPETPPWEQARWLERQGIRTDDLGIPYEIGKLFPRTDDGAHGEPPI